MADHNIPLEIQEEIIKKLPIKSLIRFTAASKPWKSFIQSSKFIARYQQTQRLLVSYVNLRNKIKYVSVADDDTYPVRELSFVKPISVDYSVDENSLVGSSQGLFCYYSDDTATIWNPSIKKSVDIVVPNVLDTWPYLTIVGFGVCPQTCDPKLVKIINLREYKKISSIRLPVQVFTLSSGVWRSLYTSLPRESIWFFAQNQVDIDGFIYWRALDRPPERGLMSKNMIMSFDMKSTEFAEINLPSSLSNSDEICHKISKLRESLVVLEYNQRADKRVYGVWMMENGDPKLFTKLFTIDSPHRSSIRQVYGFSKAGKPIIVMENDCSLSVYEPNSKVIKHIGISAKQKIRFAISYTGTLLLLHH